MSTYYLGSEVEVTDDRDNPHTMRVTLDMDEGVVLTVSDRWDVDTDFFLTPEAARVIAGALIEAADS